MFNFITKTIYFAHLGTLFIYALRRLTQTPVFSKKFKYLGDVEDTVLKNILHCVVVRGKRWGCWITVHPGRVKKEINFYVIYIYPLVFYMLVHNSSWLWCVVAVVCIPSGSVKKK